ALEHPTGPRLRLDPHLLHDFAGPIDEVVSLAEDHEVADAEVVEALRSVLRAVSGSHRPEGAAAARLAEMPIDWQLHGRGAAVTARTRSLDDDDALSLTRRVELQEHQTDVAERAMAMARRAGVTEPLISDLLVAALLHDEGKRLDSFQAALGGNGASDGALAKSGLPRRLWAQSRHDAGLPARFRHEA